MIAAGVVCLLLAACGQSEEKSAAGPPPTPADFRPCNVITAGAAGGVLGADATVLDDDNTGATEAGWAVCRYGTDGAVTVAARVKNLPTSAEAAATHQALTSALTGAENLEDGARLWSEGDTLNLQYARNRWVVRYSLEGSADDATRRRFLAARRWP